MCKNKSILGDASIVDQDVDAFKIGFRSLTKRLDFVSIGQISREQLDPVSKLSCQCLQFFNLGAVQSDDSALSMQHAGDSPSYGS